MRISRHLVALVFGTTIALGMPLSASRAGAGNEQQPTERQQQAIDVLTKLNSVLVPTREEFVVGSLWFIAYHELGHFLIDEFDIPVLGGREEDMADAYTLFRLAPNTAKEKMQSPVRLWLYYALQGGANPIKWWDAHSLDHQRAFQLTCFLSGRWPESYGGMPEAFGASPGRTEQCKPDAYRTQASWDEALRSQSASVIHKQKAKVTYVPAPNERLRVAETWLRANRLLEAIATELPWYRLPEWRVEKKLRALPGDEAFDPKVEVIAQSCAQANAFYAPESATPMFQPKRPRIIICYELIEDVRWLAEQALPERRPNN